MLNIATIGFFDGVHQGHVFLIRQIKEQAQELGLAPVVVTFSNHPKSLLNIRKPSLTSANHQPSHRLLTPIDEKEERLKAAGIHHCIILPFTKELSLMSAHDFMMLLRDKYNVKALMMGFDNSFGHECARGKDYQSMADSPNCFPAYQTIGKELGIIVTKAEPMLINGEKISSTTIRTLVKEGRIKEANNLLGYHYTITGTVVEGRHIGRTIGFPTANIHPSSTDKLLPANGVYAARVGGLKAMVNIGTNPTVSRLVSKQQNNKTTKQQISIEAHIIGRDADLYGQTLNVELTKWLRDEKHFASINELKKQLTADREEVSKLL